MVNSWGKAGAYAGLAFTIPAMMYVCYQIGVWADGKLGTHIFYLLGIVAGLVGGLYELIRQADRIERGPGPKR